jgi:hypothetical protein
VGQTSRQGASLQCIQLIGKNIRCLSGYSLIPPSTTCRQASRGNLFVCLQTMVQARHPIHFRKSMTTPHRINYYPPQMSGYVRMRTHVTSFFT